jgi:hypothetical protein
VYLGIDPHPWQAAAAIAAAPTIGALLSLIRVIAPPTRRRVPVTVAHYQLQPLLAVGRRRADLPAAPRSCAWLRQRSPR